MGMKFGADESTQGRIDSSVPYFIPSVQEWSCDAPKGENFIQFRNTGVNTPQGHALAT